MYLRYKIYTVYSANPVINWIHELDGQTNDVLIEEYDFFNSFSKNSRRFDLYSYFY